MHGISLVSTSIVNRLLRCARKYLTRTLIKYKVQMITEACIALERTAEMRPFSKMVCVNLMLNYKVSVF